MITEFQDFANLEMLNKFSQKGELVLTPEEETSLAYWNYPGRPRVINADEAINSGVIEYSGDDIIYSPSEEDSVDLGNEAIKISPRNQYLTLVEATMFGLNDALVAAELGVSLRAEFDKELETFYSKQGAGKPYGCYVYYPSSGDIALVAPPNLHKLALITSNSSLYLDPKMEKSWEEVRDIFGHLVFAVAGASVGNGIFYWTIRDILPAAGKIADHNPFKVSNAGRVRLGYRNIVWSKAMQESQFSPWGLRNKAVEAVQQVHELDPYMDLRAYFEGVNEQNVDSFIGGNRIEPKANIVVEETDNPDAKVLIREKCREHHCRVIMASDEGSSVQIDIRNFDINPHATLAYGVSDEELYQRQDDSRQKPGDREAFLKFADSLIGNDYKGRGEFGGLIQGRIPKLFASIPQLGSTACMAGGIVAEVIARTALGYKYPERFVIDKRTLEIKCWGELV